MAGHAVEHDYHLIDPSPWPLVASMAALVWCFGMVIFFKGLASADSGTAFFLAKGAWPILAGGILFSAYAMFAWWKDVTAESRAGDHTPVVQLGLRYGMIMFIMQEVMFFVGWFWMFFELGLFHKVRAGWNPDVTDNPEKWADSWTGGLHTVDPWNLPLMNTLVLLLSGTTVTWAHHALIHGKRNEAKWGLGLTILLGIAFTALQALEYYEIFTHRADGEPWYDVNAYGSIFIFATGFHGFHVLIGTIFLLVCWSRLMAGGFTAKKHFGFEAAAWYWHFVDVVWIFLFAFIYVLFQYNGVH
ncbi:cytochrome c oxidase subunit 3 [Robiginitomaculum antarcticum]|uniref:cytochrome c oxidase subunit 3 n=1 Tax=Robiginitomaculum antarcticum TaxID=437507 RepID=UPI00036B1C15|nr:cytochrome c oxidase subunit 3 [Robiginitomaculum antarcticum]